MSAVESAKSSAALAVGTIQHDALVKEYRLASGRAAAVFERRCNEAILAKSDQLQTDKNLTALRGSGIRSAVECVVQELEQDDRGDEEPNAGLEDMIMESDPDAPTSHFTLTPVLPDGKRQVHKRQREAWIQWIQTEAGSALSWAALSDLSNTSEGSARKRARVGK